MAHHGAARQQLHMLIRDHMGQPRLFPDSGAPEEARLSHVITDKHVELLPGRTMVGHTAYPIVIAKGSVI